MEIGNIILESFFQAKIRLEHEHYVSGRVEAYLREEIFIEAHRFLMSMPMSTTSKGVFHSGERFEYKGIVFFNNKGHLSFLGLERHRLVVPLAYIDLERVIAFFMEVNDYCQIPIFVIETGGVASCIPETPKPFSTPDSYEIGTHKMRVTEDAIKKITEDTLKIKPPETKWTSSLIDSLKIWKHIADDDKKI